MADHILIMLSFLLISCSTGKKQRDAAPTAPTTTVDSIITKKIAKRSFDVYSTAKCEQTNLSNQFDVGIEINRYLDTIEIFDSCVLKVFIKNKQTKTFTDTIFLNPLFYSCINFSNCDSSTTSLITGFNSKRPFVDNYYGDLIISDFNFDRKDDIAIINDCGGNGGPFYSYFIQENNCRFKLDNFLTDTVTYFPHTIDKLRQRLITYVHAGACFVGEHVYQYNRSKRTWRQIGHKILKP